MNEAEIERVVFTQDRLAFELKDGRTISVPLTFYPTLLRATPAQRGTFELFPTSIHWPELDCDIGVEGLLAGVQELPVYANRLKTLPVSTGNPAMALRLPGVVPGPEAQGLYLNL